MRFMESGVTDVCVIKGQRAHTHPHTVTVNCWIRCSIGLEYNRRSIWWTAVTETVTLTNTKPRIILSAEVSLSAPHLSQ